MKTATQQHLEVFHRRYPDAGLTVMRGAWSKQNHIFARCKACNGTTIHGVCQCCGFVTVCCMCQRVRQADGSWRKQWHDRNHASHTFCLPCLTAYKKAFNIPLSQEGSQWN